MADIPETEQRPLSYQEVMPSVAPPRTSAFSHFLTYLAFEGPALRIGIEITLCVVFYIFAAALVPWKLLGVPAHWHALLSWFSACAAVAMIDQLLICRSLNRYRRARELDLLGQYDEALEVLEEISPRSNSLIRCPRPLYHLNRAQMLIHAEHYEAAERELELAERLGISLEQVLLTKSRMWRIRGEYGNARCELEAARQLLGERMRFEIEDAILQYEEGCDNWNARNCFQEILNREEEVYPNAGQYMPVVQGYWAASLLRTGRAEEGLSCLSAALERLRTATFYRPNLKPILAALRLERAFYLATHGEPKIALQDLSSALETCSYPHLLRRAEQVKDELRDRQAI